MGGYLELRFIVAGTPLDDVTLFWKGRSNVVQYVNPFEVYEEPVHGQTGFELTEQFYLSLHRTIQ